jgi:hypothetical protein
MSLTNLLKENKSDILRLWFEAVLESYSQDTVNFLVKEKDRFANPVGYAYQANLETIIDGLTDDAERDAVLLAIDNVVKIRNVQDFAPSQAVAIFFLLKGIIRKRAKEWAAGSVTDDELLELDVRIDNLALAAFDCYSSLRELMGDIRIREAQRRIQKLMDRMNIFNDKIGQEGDATYDGS